MSAEKKIPERKGVEAGVGVVRLSRPMEAHGEEIREIRLRPPKGEDLMTCGYPFQINMDESITPLTAAIGKYISRLGGVPAHTVRDLSARDFHACLEEVLGFFDVQDSPRKPSSTAPAGTPPES